MTDVLIFYLDKAVKILAGKMFLGTQKHIQNQISLGGPLQALSLNMLKKNFLLFGHKLGGRCDVVSDNNFSEMPTNFTISISVWERSARYSRDLIGSHAR